MSHRFSRNVIRASMALVAIGLLAVGGAASADTPAQWPKDPRVTALDWSLVLVLIPLGIAAIITLLVMVTNRGDAYQPGEAWQGKDEWFGGPSNPAARGAGSDSTGGAGADF
jgi:hypothetical protein